MLTQWFHCTIQGSGVLIPGTYCLTPPTKLIHQSTTMNFRIQNLAASILNKTYFVENEILRHFQSNTTSPITKVSLSGKSLLDAKESGQAHDLSSTDPAMQSIATKDTYYDYLDDMLSSSDSWSEAVRNSTATLAPPTTVAPPAASDWNNITVHLNQTWIQRSSWGDLFASDFTPVLLLVVVLLVCCGLYRLWLGVRERRTYRQYSLVYPEEDIRAF